MCWIERLLLLCGPLLVSPSPAEIRPRECRRREKIAIDRSQRRDTSREFRTSMLYFKIWRKRDPQLLVLLNCISLTGMCKKQVSNTIMKLRRCYKCNFSYLHLRLKIMILKNSCEYMSFRYLNCSQFMIMHKNYA